MHSEWWVAFPHGRHDAEPPTHARAVEQNPNKTKQNKCSACGSSICGRECAEKRWKQHRPECRRLQAVAFGEEYAREQDRSSVSYTHLTLPTICSV